MVAFCILTFAVVFYRVFVYNKSVITLHIIIYKNVIITSKIINKSVRDKFMERFIIQKLLNWKNSAYRKPLILKGVRQVGKTWILKEFGRRCYENTAYFNFDENEEYSSLW